jgi:Fe-S cluster assembly iron-binding protein IscA
MNPDFPHFGLRIGLTPFGFDPIVLSERRFMIEISDAEKNEIKSILDQNPGKFLRIVVEGDGCAGPYFGVSLEAADLDEKTVRVNGIELLVSDQVQLYSDVTTINLFVNHPVKELP